MSKELLFKVLNTDGSACHGGRLAWPLPNGKPGKWVKVEGDLVPCRNGLHLCTAKQLLGWLGPTVWVAEAGRGRVVEADKIVVRRARLVGSTGWNERTARLFACDCAERALTRERESGREPDKRSWAAVDVARRFANGHATGQELAAAVAAARDAVWDAARAAARDAVWDAVWDAARAAAWYAARAAARAAARYAARDAAWTAAWTAAWDAAQDDAGDAAGAAAWDAEREWQTDRLLDYLGVQLHGRQ